MKLLNEPNDLASFFDKRFEQFFDMDVGERALMNIEDNLSGVEHLLSQSLKGFHFAFEKQDIKLAMGSPLNGISEFEYENREKVQEIFIGFVQCKSLEQKQTYLKSLQALDKELLIKAYFNILENTLRKCNTTQH